MKFSKITAPMIALAILSISNACSKPVTCAVEGCKNGNGIMVGSQAATAVNNSSSNADADAKPADASQSVDAKIKASQAEVQQKIDAVSDRLSLMEAMGALHSEALKLQDARISSLEVSGKKIEESIAGLDSRVSENKAAIEASQSQLESAYSELSGSLSTLSTKQQSDIVAANAQIETLSTSFGRSIEALEAADAANLLLIKDKLEDLKTELLQADADNRVLIEEKIEVLNASFESKLEDASKKLSEADAANLKKICSAIRSLNLQIFAIVRVSAIQAAKFTLEIRRINGEIKHLDKKEEKRHEELKAKIADLRKSLAKEVAKLDVKLNTAFARIATLEEGQNKLTSDLAALQKNFDAYTKAQEVKNATYAQISFVNAKVSEINDQIKKIPDDIKSDYLKAIQEAMGSSLSDIANLQLNVGSLSRVVNELSVEVSTSSKDLDDLSARMKTAEDNIKSNFESLNKLISDKTCNIGIILYVHSNGSITEDQPSNSNARNYTKRRIISCNGFTFSVLVP